MQTVRKDAQGHRQLLGVGTFLLTRCTSKSSTELPLSDLCHHNSYIHILCGGIPSLPCVYCKWVLCCVCKLLHFHTYTHAHIYTCTQTQNTCARSATSSNACSHERTVPHAHIHMQTRKDTHTHLRTLCNIFQCVQPRAHGTHMHTYTCKHAKTHTHLRTLSNIFQCVQP